MCTRRSALILLRLFVSIPVVLTLAALSHHTVQAGESGVAPVSHDMEALLVKSLLSINNNKLDVALNEVDTLLKINPNFKLAQLVRGDLLLAHAKPLSDFGNMPGASRAQMEGLRDEARARLKRFQQQPPTLTPAYLWHLDAEQRHAVVIDTSKSTLYLYENVNGEARYVADFYISIGKEGAAKIAEGDQKTPLGVYFISSSLPKSKLTDFYGSGAYPINYPNEWDKKQRHAAGRAIPYRRPRLTERGFRSFPAWKRYGLREALASPQTGRKAGSNSKALANMSFAFCLSGWKRRLRSAIL